MAYRAVDECAFGSTSQKQEEKRREDEIRREPSLQCTSETADWELYKRLRLGGARVLF